MADTNCVLRGSCLVLISVKEMIACDDKISKSTISDAERKGSVAPYYYGILL